MQQTTTNPRQMTTFAAVLAGVIAIFIALTVTAGFPPAENLPAFVAGVAVMVIFTGSVCVLGWYLLLKPLPAGMIPAAPVALSASTRSTVALLLTLSAISTGIAGAWDEIWHSTYGVPFGEDLLWRPHLLLYASFIALLGVGVWSWWTVMHRAKGTLQQRFRGSPLLGISFLGGLFGVYALAADPVWHVLYGEDISPWSIPHLLILILFLLMGLLAAAYHKTLMPARRWQVGFGGIGVRDLLIILGFTSGMVDFLLLFTFQWYAAANAAPDLMALAASGADAAALAAAGGRTVATGQLMQVVGYPDWLLLSFIVFIATLFGGLALHTTRMVGAATLVVMLALVARYALDVALSSVYVGAPPLLMILPLLLALDGLYALWLVRTGRVPPFWVSGLFCGVMVAALGALLIPTLFPYLPTDPASLLSHLIAGAVTGVGILWLAQMISALMDAESPPAQAVPDPRPLVSLTIYAGFAVFVVVFIATAAPPV